MEANNQRKNEYNVGVNKALWSGLKNRTYVKDHNLTNKTYNNQNASEAENLSDKTDYNKNAVNVENLANKLINKRTFTGSLSEESQIAEKKSPEKNSVKAENLANVVQRHSYVKKSESENFANEILEKRTFVGLFSEEAKYNEVPEKDETTVAIAKEADTVEKAIADYEKEPVKTPAEEKPYEKQVDKTPVQDAKEYLTLEDLAKIPGAKSVAMMNNTVLALFKQENPELYFVKREGKCQKTLYQACAELFEYVLKDPSKAEETAKNWKEPIRKTEAETYENLINKIIKSDETYVSIDEICRLPGTKTYKSTKAALETYAILNRKNKTIELKQASGKNSKPTYENKYKLTEELIDMIFVDKKIAGDLKVLLKEKKADNEKKHKESITTQESIDKKVEDAIEQMDEKSKAEFVEARELVTKFESDVQKYSQASEEQTKVAAYEVQPQAVSPQSFKTHIDNEPKKSKGQLRREKEEAEKDEIRRFLVRKSGITGGNVRKTGGSRTDIGNLYKGLPDHKKALAKKIIDEWVRQGIIEVIRSNYVSFNPRNLDQIRPYAED